MYYLSSQPGIRIIARIRKTVRIAKQLEVNNKIYCSYLPNEQGDNIQHREDVEEIKTMLTQTYKMKNFVPGEVTNFKPPYD
jgi:hypothetical protein